MITFTMIMPFMTLSTHIYGCCIVFMYFPDGLRRAKDELIQYGTCLREYTCNYKGCSMIMSQVRIIFQPMRGIEIIANMHMLFLCNCRSDDYFEIIFIN